MKSLFVAVVVFHFIVVALNVSAFFILPVGLLFTDLPWWYIIFLVVPVQSLIVYLSFDRNPCPLTRLENHLRKQLGMKQIGGFIGHYVIKQRWRKPRCMMRDEAMKAWGFNENNNAM